MPKAQRELVKSGEMSVAVVRPDASKRPAGVSEWGWHRNGLKHWSHLANPRQQVRVSYSLYRDPGLLDRMIDRAKANRSGTSVRGWARVTASGQIDEGFTSSHIAEIVKYAANNAAHRSTEGPASVTVKLLEALEPFEPVCSQCRKVFAEHVAYETEDYRGGYVNLPDGRREYDPTIVNIRTQYACPGQDVPAPTPLATAHKRIEESADVADVLGALADFEKETRA